MSSSGIFPVRTRSLKPRAGTSRSIATKPCVAGSRRWALRSQAGCGRSRRLLPRRRVRRASSARRACLRQSFRIRLNDIMKVAAFRAILAAAEGLYRDGGNDAAAAALGLLARLLAARDAMTVAAFAALLAKAPTAHDSG